MLLLLLHLHLLGRAVLPPTAPFSTGIMAAMFHTSFRALASQRCNQTTIRY
jgi:hypothetical protein